MKVKHLKKYIKDLPDEADFLVSSDEELNTLYNCFQVARLGKANRFVIYGLSGFEEES